MTEQKFCQNIVVAIFYLLKDTRAYLDGILANTIYVTDSVNILFSLL